MVVFAGFNNKKRCVWDNVMISYMGFEEEIELLIIMICICVFGKNVFLSFCSFHLV